MLRDVKSPTLATAMTPFPYAIDAAAPLSEARAMLTEHGFHHLPVMAGGKLTGVLRERDVALVELVNELADAGIRVIVAGLDQDFRRSPFGPMPGILATAEFIDKVHAICVRCGDPAHYSQRIAGGDEQVQVGDTESYEARCRRCYQDFQPGGPMDPPVSSPFDDEAGDDA